MRKRFEGVSEFIEMVNEELNYLFTIVIAATIVGVGVVVYVVINTPK